MPKGLNKVILIGHLGQDPEVSYTQTGHPVANVSLATTEKWTDSNGQKQQRTEWHRLVAWRKLAEIMQQWLHKGDLICVEGKLQTEQWERDGVKHYTTKVIVNQMLMLGTRGGGQGNQGGGQSQGAPQGDFGQGADFGQQYNEPDDDISF